MQVNAAASALLKSRIDSLKEIFCRSLFLSARWFVLSDCAQKGLHCIILPNSEAAEYCANDLYNLIDGDKVFFLPASGAGVERSNYKSSLSVQRTSAVQSILSAREDELTVIVTFPEALEEPIPLSNSITSSAFELRKGQEISHGEIIERLVDLGFERVDFVASPGQFAVRGSIIDLFSYSDNEAVRLSFWGDEIEIIHTFNCNTQLSGGEVPSVQVISDMICNPESANQNILEAQVDQPFYYFAVGYFLTFAQFESR